MAHRGSSHPHSDRHVAAWTVLAALTVAGVLGASWLARRAAEPAHPPDSAPGRTARRRKFGAYTVVGKTVTINRPRTELYRFWRNFGNLADFMENIVSVEEIEVGRMRWIIKAPLGTNVMVDTRIVDDRPDSLIAWRSVDGSQIATEGKVTFRDAPVGRGTEVEAIIAYRPPAGEIGRLVASLFSREPLVQGRRELKRLKMLMETGEIATSRNRHDAA